MFLWPVQRQVYQRKPVVRSSPWEDFLSAGDSLRALDRQFSEMDRQLTDLFSHFNRQAESADSDEQEYSGLDSRCKSAVVPNPDGSKQLQLQFNMRCFKPEELTVETVDNKLQVYAKHEEQSDNGVIFQEYRREFQLPESMDLQQMKSKLGPDGILTVEGPLPAPAVEEGPKEHIIPIQHQTSKEGEKAVTK